MENDISTLPSRLCLLCRSTHGESECVYSQESCYTGTYSSRSTPTFSDIYLCSATTPVPSASSHSQYSTPTLFRTNSTQWKSRDRGLQSSKLLWMFSITAVIALSSAASLAHRNTEIGDQTGIIGSDRLLDFNTAEIDTYLESFGYYTHHHQSSDSRPERREDVPVLGPALPQDLHIHHTQHEREQALRRLQKFFHLPRTGFADGETKKLTSAKRCGVKDIIVDDDDDDDSDELKIDNNGAYNNGELVTEREISISFPGNKKRRRKRFAVGRYKNGRVSKWRTNRLTWKLVGPSSQLSEQQQKETIRQAFALWARVIPIEFPEETGSEEADIRLLFGRRQHGPRPDPVFDGRRAHENTLAHAWGPHPQPKGFPGDVHFDEDDDWSKPDELFIVAAHELGHSFGLLHSEDRASIMFPVYQNLPRLGQDDLDAVDYLYGPGSDQSWKTTRPPWTRRGRTERKHYTVRPEWVTRPPPRGVDTCGDVIVDAFLPDPAPHSKNFFIAVSGDRVHRVSPRGDILQSESLNSVFPDLPESPDVGLSVVHDQAVFFIKGETMWGYKQGSPIEGFPRPISEMGFPEQPQFSISLQDNNGNDRPLLFGKSYWWLFDSQGYTTGRYDPIFTFSRDLPDDVNFVAQWSDKRLYAVSNNSYVVLDSIQRSATHENPIAGKPDWLSPLCEEIKRPSPKGDNTVAVVFACLAALCVVIGGGFFLFLKFRKNYRAYI